MGNIPKFPGLLTLSRITRLLFDQAVQAGRPIEFSEYLAGCRQFAQAEGYEIPANFERHIADRVRGLQALLRAAKRQKTFLPLDPRKGGEIRLTEEDYQRATSEVPEGVLNIPPPSPKAAMHESYCDSVAAWKTALTYKGATLSWDIETKGASLQTDELPVVGPETVGSALKK